MSKKAMLIDVDSSIPNYTFSINHTDCMKFMRTMGGVLSI